MDVSVVEGERAKEYRLPLPVCVHVHYNGSEFRPNRMERSPLLVRGAGRESVGGNRLYEMSRKVRTGSSVMVTGVRVVPTSF